MMATLLYIDRASISLPFGVKLDCCSCCCWCCGCCCCWCPAPTDGKTISRHFFSKFLARRASDSLAVLRRKRFIYFPNRVVSSCSFVICMFSSIVITCNTVSMSATCNKNHPIAIHVMVRWMCLTLDHRLKCIELSTQHRQLTNQFVD